MRHQHIYMWSAFGAALLALSTFAILTVPESSAHRPSYRYAALGGEVARAFDMGKLATRIGRSDSVITASEQIFSARDKAIGDAACQAAPLMFSDAQKLSRKPGNRSALQEVLEVLLAQEKTCTVEATAPLHLPVYVRARVHLSHLYLESGRAEDSLSVLQAIQGSTPIEDYVLWLKARSHESIEDYVSAAQLYNKVTNLDDTPLKFEALTRQAHALSYAEQWEDALPLLSEILLLFPDYPRRHLARFQHAQALHELGRLEEAAHAYQQTWFEFPFKAEGEISRERVAALRNDGIVIAEIDTETLLARYRRLRIDKHWELVDTLLHELLEAHKTETGNSELENEIVTQLALNAYFNHRFEDAVRYFESLESAYQQGITDGIDRGTLYRFQSRALARLSRHQEALQALELLHSDSTPRTRLSAIARYYEDHGQYQRAFDIYDRIYSARDKRGWHYAWLLYKTAQFERAYDALSRLAQRSRGQLRAKYLYWAGRTLERAGNVEDARIYFEDVQQTYTSSYYGIQATNRLMDLEQRESLNRTLLAHADRILDSTDQVLDAMDEAAKGMASGAIVGASFDPRSQPLSEDLSPVVRTDAYQDYGIISPTPIIRQPGSTFAEWSVSSALAENLITQMGPLYDNEPPLHSRDDDDRDDIYELDRDTNATSTTVASHRVEFARESSPLRLRYSTQARIYWNGRHHSDIDFVRNVRQGEMLGPLPDSFYAYDTDSLEGALKRAADEVGDLFPTLHRALWLWEAGLFAQARREIREVALEFRTLRQRARPNQSPHELPHRKWSYLIDNRRQKTDLWGMKSDELRFPVPTENSKRQRLLVRQQALFDRRNEIEPLLVDAFKEVGEYHLIRRHALSQGGWFREDPHGPARKYWTMAYPRAFPELVIPQSMKRGINPYIVWALMLVESSFNPDSLSRADALGLLQVIPRTGMKIADMFGDEDFGPLDLLDENNSIEQGIFYLSKLVQKFHGQELFAFAGYNGGPHRVSHWLDQRGDMPLDEFIEEIPFNESRGYAKKVLRFIGIYLKIYEGIDHLYVGQNVRTDYLPQPDF